MNSRILKLFLLFAVLAFSAIMVFSIHSSYSGLVQNAHSFPNYYEAKNFNYPFPIHADEWTHLAQVVSIIDRKSLEPVNPYAPELSAHDDKEFGFHWILAGFFMLSGLDPVTSWQFLPALFFLINTIALFFFVRHFAKNYWIALLSVLFFLAVPSNINLLGNWFAVPLSFSIFLIFLFFLLLDKGFEKAPSKASAKFFILAALVFIASLAVYPLASFLMFFAGILYLVFDVKIQEFGFVKKSRKTIFGIAVFLLLVFLVLILDFFLKNLVFSRAWTSFNFNYPLWFYGIIPTILAVLGASFVFAKRLKKIFVALPALCLLNLLFFTVFEKGLFLPFERTFFYFLLGLALLAAIGLYYLLEKVYSILKGFFQEKAGNSKPAIAACVLLCLAVFGVLFANYQRIGDKDLVLLFLLEEQDFNALKFVDSHYSPGKIVLADPFISFGVFPVGKNHVVAIPGSNLGYGDLKFQALFFSPEESCALKKSILQGFDADLVVSRTEIACDFLEKKFDNGTMVFEVLK